MVFGRFSLLNYSAIMDGIDMDIEGGRGDNYPVFIKELRRLMDNNPKRNYLIAGAPQTSTIRVQYVPIILTARKEVLTKFTTFSKQKTQLLHLFKLISSLLVNQLPPSIRLDALAKQNGDQYLGTTKDGR